VISLLASMQCESNSLSLTHTHTHTHTHTRLLKKKKGEQKAIPSINGRVSRNSCLSSAICTSQERNTLWLYFE